MVRNIAQKVTGKKVEVVARTQKLTRIQLGESKRRYSAHFISKLSDSDGFLLVERSYSSERENSETDTWLDYAKDCGYITKEQHRQLVEESEVVGRMLGKMLNDPSSFLLTR